MSTLDPDDKIKWLQAHMTFSSQSKLDLIAGIGHDDCAILRFGNTVLVLTADYVNATPIIFQLGIGNFFDIGRYLVNCNLADLCGSGAKPIAIMTNIMWRRDEPQSSFEDLMRGARSAAEAADAVIIGGDTKLSSSPAYCAVAVGSAESSSQLFIKNRARAGDGIWVSGSLGSCAAAVLGWGLASMTPSWREWARVAMADPPLPLRQSRQASALGMDAAGTDLSDGLGADLASLCDASNVGAEIIAAALPVDHQVSALAEDLDVPASSFAFTVGGDLQFLLTARDSYSDPLRQLGMTRIGTIHADPAHRKLLISSVKSRNLPFLGHRDARALSFPDEVRYLLQQQGY